MRAYVLVQTDGEPVAERLRTLPGIVSADDLRGAYDAIALARSPSMRHLVEEVIPQIKEIRGVRRALPVPLAGSSGEPESSRAPDRAA